VRRIGRLEEVVVRPLPHRLDGRVRRLGHGDEDDRNARVDAAYLLVDVQAGLVGQAQVQKNNVRGLGTGPLKRLTWDRQQTKGHSKSRVKRHENGVDSGPEKHDC
jgi:hypothetical protein